MRPLRIAMRRSKDREPPSQPFPTYSSREASPSCSSALSDWDADDEGFMDSGDQVPSRPLSLSISGPYCPRRPTLQEVLANTAPPPWTLSAFTAYLSQNHCLETLEFTLDSQRYREHYDNLMQTYSQLPSSRVNEEADYVRMLWQKLLDAYIVPNSPREVNLPSSVRNRLLSLDCRTAIPDPAELDPASKIIFELMDESVLVPFLNSVAPTRAPESLSLWGSDEPMGDAQAVTSLEATSLSPSRTRIQREDSPPLSGSGSDVLSPPRGLSPRASHQSHLSRPGPSRVSTLAGPSSAASSAEAIDSMTDDSTDSPSPSGSGLEPMTPPNTPPTSHVSFKTSSPGSSRTVRAEGSSWRKMGEKLGWKKSRSNAGTSSSRYPLERGDSEESKGSGL
jgi:hypothetical protein